MIQIPEKFVDLIDTMPGKLLLLVNGETEVPQSAVRSASWSGGSNSGDDIALGGTVASKLTVKLDREQLGDIAITGVTIKAALVYEADGEKLQIPWGELKSDDGKGDDDTLTISAGDAMLWAFNSKYGLDDAQLGFDWETGVDGESLLRAICSEVGVSLRNTDLSPITLSNLSPAGYTYREIISFLCCMWGRFARIDGEGFLVLQWYTKVDRPVAANRYYMGGLVKADYEFTVDYIKCYSEMLEETLEVGDTTKEQGIYIKCPWMTMERLQAVWAAIGGFSYRPVSSLRFFGDPRLEPGDIIQVVDRNGTVLEVPCMTITHEFDGGVITEVSAVGKQISATDQDYKGPVTRQIKREAQKVAATLIKFEDRIEQKVSTADHTADLEGIRETVSEQSASITNTCEKIILDALKSYTETNDFESFRETVSAQLSLLSDQLALKFSESIERVEMVNGELQSQLNTITQHFSFTIDGLSIGQTDSPYKITIDNGLISMTENDDEVFCVAKGTTRTQTIEITKGLQLFGFLIDQDDVGNVNCGHIGGET